MTFSDIEFLFTVFIITIVVLLLLVLKLESDFKKFRDKHDDKSK